MWQVFKPARYSTRYLFLPAAALSADLVTQVLSEFVRREELKEQQAIEIVRNALFHNANRIYNLGLEPNTSLL